MHFSNASNRAETDEIDLFELCANLWKEKVLIIDITVLFTVLALAYAFLATPVYQSIAAVLPPKREVAVTVKVDAQKAQEWANLYITMEGQNAKNKMAHERNAELNSIVKGIKRYIDLLRENSEN